MNLRARLLLGLTVAFLVFGASAVFIVISQQTHLYDQLDTQLESVPIPLEARKPTPQPGRDDGPAPGPQPNDAAEPPISDLYLAIARTDQPIEVIVQGQLLADQPDLQQLVDNPPDGRSFYTIDGVDGQSRFRVLYRGGDSRTVADVIVAVPTDEVEATIDRLMLTFGVIGAVMAMVLALIAYWANRFGLAPITQMTRTADAIAAGDHDRRAVVHGDSTEAGRLATAFNVMLDQRDEAEQKLRQFVSDASHELRTPLTSIRGYLDLYAEGGFRQPGQLDDAVRRMQGESARMNLLVDELLLLAKLDEEQPLNIVTVDVSAMLDDIAASALAAHPERSVTVVAGAEQEPATISADRLRLHQALAGLVDNAITHTTPDTSVELSASAEEHELRIVVADDGPGMAAEDAAKAFDRFFRGDRSRARIAGGSGLGLAITKSIVEAHGGRIELASANGAGATFTVFLPRS